MPFNLGLSLNSMFNNAAGQAARQQDARRPAIESGMAMQQAAVQIGDWQHMQASAAARVEIAQSLLQQDLISPEGAINFLSNEEFPMPTIRWHEPETNLAVDIPVHATARIPQLTDLEDLVRQLVIRIEFLEDTIEELRK